MSANHYNLDYLKQVFQGNDAMVQRILDVFEAEVPRYFSDMLALGRQGRWRELHPLAHKAKSSIGMLGMSSLQSHVVRIESLSRSGEDDLLLSELVENVQHTLTASMDTLRRDRSNGLVRATVSSHQRRDAPEEAPRRHRA